MGKRKAVAAANATQSYPGGKPLQLGPQLRPIGGEAMSQKPSRAPLPKREGTLQGLQKRTLLGLPKSTLVGLQRNLPAALRAVWPTHGGPEASLAGLSRQVESRIRPPNRGARLKPPAPPPSSANSDRPQHRRHAADPTDHDIQMVGVHETLPRKRSRVATFALVSLAAVAVAASVHAVRSPTNPLAATKSAWLQLEAAVSQQLATITSAASAAPDVATETEPASLQSVEGLSASPEPVAAEQQPAKIARGNKTHARSKAHKQGRHRKVVTPN